MSAKCEDPGSERKSTDESLRSERERVDESILARLDQAHDEAADVVDRARVLADALLETARDAADDLADGVEQSVATRAEITVARDAADQLTRDRRSAADELLANGRDDWERTLATLMPLARQRTDRNLLIERERFDDRLANRDDFLGMVCHDLRNLLCAVCMDASEVADTAPDSSEGRETVAAMKRIERYVGRMNGLIGDLIDVVSIDAGRLAVQPARHDAGVVLAEAVGTFRRSAMDKGIALRYEAGPTPLMADLDAGRILQVLANLLANAIKFTAPGGEIVVTAERVGSEVRIVVRDTGVGIPERHLVAVFERFWQVGKDDRRGLGLGLFICKCIIDQHHGRIWVDSEVGAGSEFFFTIPDVLPLAA
jgi:signal transduction histidine kinase